MKYVINEEELDVIVIRKNNKNTYVRIKDFKIYVTTNKFVKDKDIIKLLDNNFKTLQKMLSICHNKEERKDEFYFLGNKYDIIIVPTFKIDITDDKIFVQSREYLNKWLKKETLNVFKERLDILYNNFEENIPYPNLKIRKMTTRWGVCNKKNNCITLNSELIKYGYEQIDYVIIHELSHFVHFDHSKYFWNVVSKYCPKYKLIRKILKEQ